jgi:hypothetical protein
VVVGPFCRTQQATALGGKTATWPRLAGATGSAGCGEDGRGGSPGRSTESKGTLCGPRHLRRKRKPVERHQTHSASTANPLRIAVIVECIPHQLAVGAVARVADRFELCVGDDLHFDRLAGRIVESRIEGVESPTEVDDVGQALKDCEPPLEPFQFARRQRVRHCLLLFVERQVNQPQHGDSDLLRWSIVRVGEHRDGQLTLEIELRVGDVSRISSSVAIIGSFVDSSDAESEPLLETIR